MSRDERQQYARAPTEPPAEFFAASHAPFTPPESPPHLEKVPLPSLVPGRQYDWVNAKQAQRILIRRQKKAKRTFELLQSKRTDLVPNQATVKFTKAKRKDAVRQKVAMNRVRDQGLFCKKEMELELKRRLKKKPKRLANAGSDSETDDPD